MNVIFTCGGTGGHINPAIAVANIWKERHPDSKILFVGGRGNMEEELVPKAGYPLEVLPAFGLERSFSPAAIKNNFWAIKSVLSAVRKCKKMKIFGNCSDTISENREETFSIVLINQ